MGKTKYLSMRKANKNKENIPNYVTYDKLSKSIRDIDMGILKDVNEDFGKGLPEDDFVEGCYRPLIPYAQRIAEFYLNVYDERSDSLKQFPFYDDKENNNGSPFKFLISL